MTRQDSPNQRDRRDQLTSHICCTNSRTEITLDKFIFGRQRIFPFILMQSEEKPAHVTNV
ncbi:unnamed protein product [Gulo gulo]|uniref:Uncharacterized protein n=1 Tax=Gulo gulo TaxID=48420 RepID=A0A9X9LKM0_GULGU|nr:unnamed protein product [Gulo gulo]